jgi:uncharacterized protein YebE (UPF0316 family)
VEALLIMALVLFEVALWQWRVAITVRGNSFGGALLGFVGALVQVTVIAQVVQDVGDVKNVVAYASGVAIGVFVGCVLDVRLSTREVIVRVFAPADPELVPTLRSRGWPVTATSGDGHQGPVDVLYLAIDQRTTAKLEDELGVLAPGACWTIEKVAASRGLLSSTVDEERAGDVRSGAGLTRTTTVRRDPRRATRR